MPGAGVDGLRRTGCGQSENVIPTLKTCKREGLPRSEAFEHWHVFYARGNVVRHVIYGFDSTLGIALHAAGHDQEVQVVSEVHHVVDSAFGAAALHVATVDANGRNIGRGGFVEISRTLINVGGHVHEVSCVWDKGLQALRTG